MWLDVMLRSLVEELSLMVGDFFLIECAYFFHINP